MNCKLCNSADTEIIYDGLIRNGGLGCYTKDNVKMYQCKCCNVIWHEEVISDIKNYYESEEYRCELEGSSEEKEFYNKHDWETLDKLQYTGTAIYRDKIVADIGCGCGSFLDFLKGVIQTGIAVEPSEKYRKILQSKGYYTYAYMEDAKQKYKMGIDIITSFDVIEHVVSPLDFLKDVFELLAPDGQAIIGTPTDAPIMRQLLGKVYEQKLLYSTQHLWIFSEENLKQLAQKAGFECIEIKYYQRYGLENLFGWLREKEPCSEIRGNFISNTMNAAWKSQCSENKLADYIVLYLKK